MPKHIDPRREAARAFFQFLERHLRADETFTDKHCVRLLLEKAAAEQAAQSRKRFDIEGTFRSRVLYGRIDDALSEWCRRREVRADPFTVFRFEGPERGPTQHEVAVGLARPAIERVFARIAEQVPEIAPAGHLVFKNPTKAIAPAFRLQHPLPFGAVGEVKYGGTGADLERMIHMVAMYAATGGDVSRGWRYDCGILVFYCTERPIAVVGEDRFEIWPDLQDRLWEAARVWALLV